MSQHVTMAKSRVNIKSTPTKPKRQRVMQASKPADNGRTVRSTSIRPYMRKAGPTYFKSHQAAFPQRFTETMRVVLSNPNNYSRLPGTFGDSFVVACNGLVPPFAGGPVPAGFAKLMAVYTKYVVKNCKVRWEVVNLQNTSDVIITTQPVLPMAFTAGISIKTNNLAPIDLYEACSGGLETHKLIGSNPSTVTLEQSVSMEKFLNVDDLTDGTEYNGTIATNPQEQVYAHCWIDNRNIQTLDTVWYSWTVAIDYECIFYDPAPII